MHAFDHGGHIDRNDFVIFFSRFQCRTTWHVLQCVAACVLQCGAACCSAFSVVPCDFWIDHTQYFENFPKSYYIIKQVWFPLRSMLYKYDIYMYLCTYAYICDFLSDPCICNICVFMYMCVHMILFETYMYDIYMYIYTYANMCDFFQNQGIWCMYVFIYMCVYIWF